MSQNTSNNSNSESEQKRFDDGMMPPARKNKAPRFEHKREAPRHHDKKSESHSSRPERQKAASNAEPGDNRRRGTRNPRELVVETLMRIEDGGFSNIVWDIAIRRSELNNLDKMLATRIFYGTLSNMRLIDALWTSIEPEMLKRADSVVKMTLRSAMYQLVFLDRVPAYSIVSTSVDIVKRLRNRAASGYCNALLRKAVSRQESEKGLKYEPTGNRALDFAVQYSLNDELAELLLREFGDEADQVAQSMLSVPRMILRINQSKTTMEAFRACEGIQVESTALLPETACATLSRHEAIDNALERGDVCVQDEAAQLAVCALGKPCTWSPERNDIHLWDACAGQGGKSLHLLDEIAIDTTERKYTLLSTDLYANKLDRLRDSQMKHFPKQHLVTKARDLTVSGSIPLAPFDAILVDAPCSSLGVLRRHPEVKMTRSLADIQALSELQRDILDNVSRHLRPGGILVYAVCTITQEECEMQIKHFLETHPNYRPDALPKNCLGKHSAASQLKFLPHIDGCDGFFVARFVRVS